MNKKSYTEAIHNTLDEIQELLKKSMPLQKDDEFPPQEGDEQPAPAPEMGDEQPAPEMGDEQPAPEMDEGQPEQDEVSEIAQMAEQMSDEEISGLIEMLQQSLAGRQQPAPEQAPQQAPQQEPQLDKSEFASLQKSIKAMQDEIASLKKPKAVETKKPVQKAANNQRVEILEKSTKEKVVERLTKSETENFLMGKIRSKDPNVSSRDIVNLQYARDDESLKKFQDDITSRGIQLPQK